MKIFGAVVLLVLLILIVAAVGMGWYVYNGSEAIISEGYAVRVPRLDIPSDSTSIAMGRHIAITRGCTGCHGTDLGGMINDMEPLGTYNGSNLTSGLGGIGESYRTVDWVRAIRHGVGPNRNMLMMMPSEEYYYLSDDDLGRLIAYLEQIEPVDRNIPPSEVGPVGRMLIQFGAMKTLTPARYIDHEGPRPVAPDVGVTEEYGEYLAVTCIGCHGEDMAGNVNLGPQAPMATNINPYGLGEAGYTLTSFKETMRTGRKPNGEMMDPFMPWTQFGQFTDDEMEAIYMYLRSLPAVEADR